jgi:hypothetical protein
MNSFYYISLLGTTLLVPVSQSNTEPNKLFDDYLLESHEVCATDGAMKVAIATCKVDNPHLSFEDKVRLCTIKMRPVVMPHVIK